MHRIRPWLATGKYKETQDRDALQRDGITAMLQLHRPVEQPGIPTLFIEITEGYNLPPYALEKALAFVDKHRDGHVLIACGVGISRSSSFAVAALKHVEGLSLVDAFSAVRKANPQAMPDERHWQDLCDYFGEQIDFWEMWKKIEL